MKSGHDPSQRPPSVWPVVREAFANAPPRVRQTAWSAAVAWTILVTLQALDSSDTEGLAGAAEFLSAVFGATGGFLVVVVVFLEAAAERRASGAEAAAADAESFRRVLLALPAIALTAGVLVAAAITLMIVRAMLGTPLPLVFLLTLLHVGILGFAAAIVVRSTRTLYMHASAEAGAAARARAEAGEARLAALQARMNPHFLFNALNTVAALVRCDPRTAERVTEDLSAVLRMTLDRSASGVSTIRDEIEYVRSYLAIEQVRWGDRLRIEWNVDPTAEPCPIQPLVLQPLIENALHHGIGGRADGGTIRVTIHRQTQGVQVVVEDDGDGFPPVVKERTGLGNLRQRLHTAYGEGASLEIDSPSDGARVIVSLPLEVVQDARADR